MIANDGAGIANDQCGRAPAASPPELACVRRQGAADGGEDSQARTLPSGGQPDSRTGAVRHQATATAGGPPDSGTVVVRSQEAHPMQGKPCPVKAGSGC
eukprot:9559073-Lingulodinium_polyedra.AAC.1